MASATVKLTLRGPTIDQVADELSKLKFAGYGACSAYFEPGATTRIVHISAEKVLDPPAARAGAAAIARGTKK